MYLDRLGLLDDLPRRSQPIHDQLSTPPECLTVSTIGSTAAFNTRVAFDSIKQTFRFLAQLVDRFRGRGALHWQAFQAAAHPSMRISNVE